MKIFNVSDNLPFKSQRDNTIRPLSTCNTTSLTMAARYIPSLWERFENSEAYKKHSRFERPADRLTAAMDEWKLVTTNHHDLMVGFNRFLGGKNNQYSVFAVNSKWTDLVDDMVKKSLPWVGSGTFPGFPNALKSPLGHILVVVGLEYEDTPYKPTNVIVDDPYGDVMNNWRGSGDDIKVPWNLFVKWMKPLENKDGSIMWSHRFRPA